MHWKSKSDLGKKDIDEIRNGLELKPFKSYSEGLRTVKYNFNRPNMSSRINTSDQEIQDEFSTSDQGVQTELAKFASFLKLFHWDGSKFIPSS